MVCIHMVLGFVGFVGFIITSSKFIAYRKPIWGVFYIISILLITGSLIACEIERTTEESEKEAYQQNIVTVEVMEAEEDITIFGTSSDNMVSGSISGGGGLFHYVISGSVDSTPVYKYRCRNQYGALVTKYVPSDENISMIFDTLEDNETPFLRIIHTYKVTTDNNTDPPKVEKKHVFTNYHFYVPKNSVGTELAF